MNERIREWFREWRPIVLIIGLMSGVLVGMIVLAAKGAADRYPGDSRIWPVQEGQFSGREFTVIRDTQTGIEYLVVRDTGIIELRKHE